MKECHVHTIERLILIVSSLIYCLMSDNAVICALLVGLAYNFHNLTNSRYILIRNGNSKSS